MSSNQGSSQASRDASNSMQDRDPGANQGRFDSQQKKTTKSIAKQVKKDIGLTATRGGFIAANAPDPLMYGEAASEAAKKRMAERGLGTYNAETGSFSNVVGNQIISSTGMMMGNTMGSGESTVMGQIPISQKMFDQQKKIQSIVTGGMALMGVPLAAATFIDVQRRGYQDYTKSFYGIQNENRTRNITNNNQVDASTNNRSTVVADQTATANDAEIKRRNTSAYIGLSGTDEDTRRFLNATGRNITGSMN